MSPSDFDIDDTPTPCGELALQTIAMPTDTNARGDIYAGWLLSKMDLAASIIVNKVTKKRIATVSVSSMDFMSPVHVGAVISCYANVISTGRSSMTIQVEVWIDHRTNFERIKVTDGEFVIVALNDHGRTCPIE